MNRLKKLTLGSAALIAFASVAASAMAQDQPPPMTVVKIKNNVYWAHDPNFGQGTGSNNGFIIGKKGVILVDTKTTQDAEKVVIAEIAKVTPLTVNTIFITHSDGDHVNGLASFPDGVTIVAQDNCKKEMTESVSTRNPAPQNRLPTRTYDKTDKMTVDGIHVRLYHWGPGHTSGDAVYYFPDQKIVFGGDLLISNRPEIFIHPAKGGTVAGWIENAKGILTLKADTYLTGHGEKMTREDVQKKLDQTVDKYNKVKDMVAQGKSLDDIKKSFGESAAASRSWARRRPRPLP